MESTDLTQLKNYKKFDITDELHHYMVYLTDCHEQTKSTTMLIKPNSSIIKIYESDIRFNITPKLIAPFCLPDVIIWDPKQQFDLHILCPKCNQV